MKKRMAYRRYKQFYTDCKTVKDSYDGYNKTIEVEVPSDHAVLFDLPELTDGERIQVMSYKQWKDHYKDCKTVKDSYDFECLTIRVIVPEGREKPSGVRGQRFRGYELFLMDEKGNKCHCCYRAVSFENAWKRHVAWCKKHGWTLPYGSPEDHISHIYR